MKKIVYILTIAMLVACGTKQAEQVVDDRAKGFAIEQTAEGTMLTIYAPESATEPMEQLLIETDKPFRHIATTAATHVGFLRAIGAEDCIAGVCDPRYIYGELPEVTDLGDALELDAERIIAAGTDLLLISYSQDNKAIRVLNELGIKTITINEWTEQHPLARAEWIRVFGALTGHEAEADSVYEAVRTAYYAERDSAMAIVGGMAQQPMVFSGSCWQGTWYVPSGTSYMCRIFLDAGAAYRYADDKRGGSIPLTIEEGLLAFKDADIWVGAPGAGSLKELSEWEEKYTWLKAYQTGRVYTTERRMNEKGANDYWEQGVVHPELILRDMRLILSNAPDSLLYFCNHLQ